MREPKRKSGNTTFAREWNALLDWVKSTVAVRSDSERVSVTTRGTIREPKAAIPVNSSTSTTAQSGMRYAGNWSAGVNYSEGDLVSIYPPVFTSAERTDSAGLWHCIQAHLSSDASKPIYNIGATEGPNQWGTQGSVEWDLVMPLCPPGIGVHNLQNPNTRAVLDAGSQLRLMLNDDSKVSTAIATADGISFQKFGGGGKEISFGLETLASGEQMLVREFVFLSTSPVPGLVRVKLLATSPAPA